MAAGDTSVRVSRQTLVELDRLREVFHTRSADETILKLVRERRSRALGRMFGSGRGVVSSFAEDDHVVAHD